MQKNILKYEYQLLQGLVDYEGGDSDEEEEEGGEVTKRARLS